MSTLFVASYFVLWGFFLAQSVLILVVLRQIGLLHLRIRPAGARIISAGADIGDQAPPITLTDIDDASRTLTVSTHMDQDVLLLFASPNCSSCAGLMPSLKPLIRQTKGKVLWAVVTYGDHVACTHFRRKYGLTYVLYAISPEAAAKFKIGLTPYVFSIRKDGVVLSKGVANHVEHLESILQIDLPGPKPEPDASEAVATSGEAASSPPPVGERPSPPPLLTGISMESRR